MPSDDNEDLPSTSDVGAPTPSTNIVIDPPPPSNPGSSMSAGFNFPTNPLVPPPNVLPSVPQTPDNHPGGFYAYVAPAAGPTVPTAFNPSVAVTLTPDQMTKAQKYCKWAASALTYDDIQTAVTNLSNALQLLQTGHDPA